MSTNPVDLGVTVGSLRLENPFILASAPPTADGNFIRKAFDLGWAGAVIKTIKPDELEIEDVSPRFGILKDQKGSIIGFENFELVSKKNVAYWTNEIKTIKKEYPSKILIASIMADLQKESWVKLSEQMEKAGADALELNFSCPHGMPEKGIGSAIGQDPSVSAKITGWVKGVVSIPVIVKLSPNVTDIRTIATAVQTAGADAIAAINTVQCLVGVDIETFEPLPNVGGFSTYGGYSGLAVKPIGLRCVSQISQSVDVPVYGIGGISQWQDAVEYIAVGAGAVQVCTAAMLNGFAIIKPMLKGLENYMQRKGIKSLGDICGLAAQKMISHKGLNRQYFVKAEIVNAEKCIMCKKCVTACHESGYEAIHVSKQGIIVDRNKCDGCSLCSFVCPKEIIKMKSYQAESTLEGQYERKEHIC
jgi:dihydropyrimidine dehydrogenase (NAD+) subunit PreA